METILLSAFVDNANPEGCNQYKDCGGGSGADSGPATESSIKSHIESTMDELKSVADMQPPRSAGTEATKKFVEEFTSLVATKREALDKLVSTAKDKKSKEYGKRAKERLNTFEHMTVSITPAWGSKAYQEKHGTNNTNTEIEYLVSNFTVNAYRREVVNGREFIVAPLVSIREGVLNGSKGALFYPADEIGRDPQAWNGMPLVKGHPTKNGQHISGRDPWVRQHLQMGTIYNSVYDDKLHHEAWFDVEDTKRVDNWVYQQLIANKPIEVSTGLFTDNEPTQGTYNGRTYDYVARNYRPDHMAILVGQRGACSNKDGCGVNVNANNNPEGCNQYKECGEGGGDSAVSETKAFTEKVTSMTDGQLRKEFAKVDKKHREAMDKAWEKHGAETGAGDLVNKEGPNSELGKLSMKRSLLKHEAKERRGISLNVDPRTIWTKLGELLGLVSNDDTECAECGEKECNCEKTENAGVYGNPQSTATGKFKRHGAGTGKGEVHEAAQRGMMIVDDVDRQRGASAKAELEATGQNPASWVADEGTWEKAKEAADKGGYGADEYWAVVSHIYKKMGGEIKEPAAPAAPAANANPEGCNQYKDCGGGGGDVVNTLKEMNTKNDVENWSFEKVDQLTSALGKMPVKDVKEAVANIYGEKRGPDMARGSRKEIVERVKDELKDRIASYDTSKTIGKMTGNSRESDFMDCQEECDDMDCVDECLADFIGNSLTGETMATPTREQAINQLVTNCDCWKGKQEVLANKDSFSDEDVQRLLKAFNARKLAVNTLREIGVATGAPSTLTVNEMPAFIKAKMGKGDEEEEPTEEEEEEEPMMNKTTKNAAKKNAPITERLSPDELEVWNNAVKITANEKKKIVSTLVANLSGDYRKEKYKKLMTKSMDDLREMLELQPTSNRRDDDYEEPTANGIGGFFTPDFDDSNSGGDRTDNADDGEPLGLPSASLVN